MGPHFIWKLKSVFGLNLLLLKTENWKHYNKIIFKCVNSIVGSFLIFFNMWTVINSAYTVNPCEATVHVLEKKKKTWTWENAQAKRPLSVCLDPRFEPTSAFCTFVFFFFFFHAFWQNAVTVHVLFNEQ